MMTQKVTGIGASPGLAIAKAIILNTEIYIPTRGSVEQPELEVQRFATAVQEAYAEIEQIRVAAEEKLGKEKAEIFEGHLLILEDPDLIDVVKDQISEEAVNAEYALHEVSQTFIEMLSQMEDELLRERAVDIRDVCGRVMNRLRGIEGGGLSQLTEECIINCNRFDTFGYCTA